MLRYPHLTATGEKGSPILQDLLHGDTLKRQQILFCSHLQLDLLEGIQGITCTIAKTCGGLIVGAFVRQSPQRMQMRVINLSPDSRVQPCDGCGNTGNRQCLCC